jgi:hypothetical protein
MKSLANHGLPATTGPIERSIGMSTLSRYSIWLNRLVLGFAIFVFSMLAVRYIGSPVKTEAPHQIVLGSPEAITNTRVSGGVFLAMALVLFASAVSRKHHRDGLLLLAVFSGVLTAVRVFGLILDGPAPFTLFVLKPEITVTVLAAGAYLLERRMTGRLNA